MSFDNSNLPGFADLTISDGTCSDSDSLFIPLASGLCDTVSFTIIDNTYCDSVGLEFTNTTSNSSNVYFDWSIPGLVANNYYTWNNNVYAYDFTSGTYNITLSMYSDSAMTNLIDAETQSFTYNATINNLTALFIHTIISSNCTSSQIQLTDLSSGSPTSWSWHWYDNGWQFSNQQNPIITLDSGIQTVYLSVQDSNFCSSYYNSTINVTGNGLIATAQDSNMHQDCDSTTIQFYGFDVNATSYSWYFHDGQTSALANPVMSFDNSNLPGFADLTISDGTCTDSDSLFIPLSLPAGCTGSQSTNCLSFDGNDYIQVNNTSLNSIDSNDFTFEASISGNTANNSSHSIIFSKRTLSTGVSFFIHDYWNNSQYKMFAVQIEGINYLFVNNGAFNGSILDGGCHHLAATRSGNVLSLYIDGMLIGTHILLSSTNISNQTNLRIGSDPITNA